MEGQSGLLGILWVSAVKGCPLAGFHCTVNLKKGDLNNCGYADCYPTSS